MIDGADEIESLIRETSRAMVRSVEHQFDESQVTFSQWLILNLACEGKISCLRDVTREIGLDGGYATRLIDQLEGKCFLKRVRSKTDRRIVKIRVSPLGREIVQAMKPQMRAFWDRQLSALSDSDLSHLVATLTTLRDTMLAESGRSKQANAAR